MDQTRQYRSIVIQQMASDRRDYLSNSLNRLLSSTADATSVDDCFSSTSNVTSNLTVPQSTNENSFDQNHHHHHHHHDAIISRDQHDDPLNGHHHEHHVDHHQNHDHDTCVIGQDSVTGLDDDDGMHNMLSGSSTSSTSTMPLLTESHHHSHHNSFSRISLDEYSPLSLVEDCDNALTISPTSLACNSHQSNKSLISFLSKIDNDVDVGVDDVVVGDARSMSPNLLSASTSSNHDNHLWSNSSTAITQNPALLTSTSTSYLLSHHHHHHQQQMNSLMQLEPQSLDEAPTTLSNNVVGNHNNNHINMSSFDSVLMINHRPSSEPPPGTESELSAINTDAPKSIQGQTVGHSKLSDNNSTNNNNNNKHSNKSGIDGANSAASSSASSGTSSSRRNRSRSGTASSRHNSQLLYNKAKDVEDDKLAAIKIKSQDPKTLTYSTEHQAQLKQLTMRLIGTASNNDLSVESFSSGTSSKSVENKKARVEEKLKINKSLDIKKEADSSAADKEVQAETEQKQQLRPSATSQSIVRAPVVPHRKVYIEPGTGKKYLCTPFNDGPYYNISSDRCVTTETAEPDTTTKTSDCIKANLATTIGTHQIAIQLICGDGTSLVLPVPASAGLNAAAGLLTSQHHQQLQAVLAGNINCSTATASNNNNNQSRSQELPFISVSNIIPQQQGQQQSSTTNNDTSSTITKNIVLTAANYNQSGSSSSSSSSSTSQNSGLAASSPTLAALLDAGSSSKGVVSSNHSNDFNNNNHTSTGQNSISGNLLRKLISGGGNASSNTDLKRGIESNANGSGLATQVGKNSLITVCTTNNLSNNALGNKSINLLEVVGNGTEKRIKMENVETANSNNNNTNNTQTTLTLIDPQGLIVAHGNDKLVVGGKQALVSHAKNAASCNTIVNSFQQQLNSVNTKTAASSDNSTGNNSTTGGSKQNKMASSTGNRQVDPAQPFRCEHCNSTFTRLGNFTRHKKIHTVPTKDGQRFKCEVCSKSFLQRCDLARHLHIHRGTEPHRCNICGKGYIRHSDLVTHQRFHNKEKPFGCPHCSKGFCQRGDLNRHLRSIHLQMKPILCPCCNRKFAKQETLLRHLNTAHRNKPGANTTGATVISELPPNFTPTNHANDNQSTNPVTETSSAITTNSTNVSNGNASNNNDNTLQKTNNAPVASLQAIQATLCKVQRSAESTDATTSIKSTEMTNIAKVVS